MWGKNPTILISVLLLGIMATSSKAIVSPAPAVEVPAAVKEAQKEISKTYGGSGVARLLQSIKLEKEMAIKNGSDYRSRIVNIGLPVLVGNYSDVSHIFTPSEFNEHLFGSNPTGSMSDYYDEVSYGQFQLSGTVYGPYTAEREQAYYAKDGGQSTAFPRNGAGFLWSLLESSDPEIDFSQYDNDGPDGIPNSGDDDGKVDGIVAIFPEGSAEGGDIDNIYTHEWLLTFAAGSMFETDDVSAGGGSIFVERFIVISSEKDDGSLNVLRPIGTICHEYGHILGLPELYDFDGSSYGIGTWGLMGLGNWGATYDSHIAEHKPTHLCAWSKEQLGFLTPIDIIDTETLQIPPVEDSPVAYRLWDDPFQGGRYFLAENRRALGFDADILDEGLIIWHCNTDVSINNADDNLRIVDIEEADGFDQIHLKINTMGPGDTYPGTMNITSFNDFSYPAATDFFGNPIGVSIEEIAYGPDLDITATLTQREELLGYTITYHPGRWGAIYQWHHGLSQTTYGAMAFTATGPGTLIGVQIGTPPGIPKPYTLRVFEGMVDNSPEGLLSTTSGTLPQNYKYCYTEIPLSSKHGLSQDETFLIDLGWGGEYEEYFPYIFNGPITGMSYFSENGANYVLQTERDFAIRARVQYCYDSDGDGYNDETSDPVLCGELDNCTDIYNPDQTDTDGDGIGDVCDFTCGDSDGSGIVDILDVVYIINYRYREGPEPYPLAYSDVDGNDSIDILDAVYIINFKYREGPEPECLI